MKRTSLLGLPLAAHGLAFALMGAFGASAHAANPIVPGWYADPEIRIFGKTYWIYPTYSDHYGQPDRSAAFTPE